MLNEGVLLRRCWTGENTEPQSGGEGGGEENQMNCCGGKPIF